MSTQLQSFKKIDKTLLDKYIQATEKKPNHFLYNTENSFKIFEEIKLKLFTFDELIYTLNLKNGMVKNYYVKSDKVESYSDDISYKECLMTGKQFEETVSFVVVVYHVIKNKKQEIVETKELAKFGNEIKIPRYVGHQGKSPLKENCYPEQLETGGFFVTKNNIRKFVVNEKTSLTTTLKYSYNKQLYHHGSFNSIPFRCVDPLITPQFLTLDMNLLPDKVSFLIKSEKTLPPLNVVLLIAYLTNYKLEDIKKFLISRFKKLDDKICNVIEIIFESTKNELIKYNDTKDLTEEEKIEKYININYIQFLNKNINGDKKIDENIFITLFLPAVNSYIKLTKNESLVDLLKIKGMTILYELENLIIAAFQTQIYPGKDNMSIRRIATPGTIFEIISTEIVKSIINQYTKQVTESLKINKNNNVTLKPFRKPQNTFNNIFNLQDSTHSNCIKPLSTTLNFMQKLNIPNLTVIYSRVKLTKHLAARDPDMSTWGYFGPVATPDHGNDVGINRNLNVGVKINDKNFETHREIIIGISKFTKKFISENSKLNNHIVEDLCNIVLVDDSEVYIGSIEQNLVLKYFEKIKEMKREFVFGTNLIDISLIPLYEYTTIKILAPVKKYRVIRINTGNKIPFMPLYIVKNGIPVITTLDFENKIEEIKKTDFDNLIFEYPNFMEYLGPEEFLYSNVCESLNVFNKLTEEEKKMYDYIAFNNILNLSILENMIFDIGKNLGSRGIFACSQTKNNVSSIQPDSLNLLETSKFSISPHQPCATNNVLLESRIPKQSYGTYALVAFMAYNENIEDAFIVNEEAVNNGLFIMISTQVYKGSTNLKGIRSETSNIKYFRNSYKKLDNNFIPKLNVILENGDALYGDAEAKVKKSNNIYFLQDNSTPYKDINPGRVDRIHVTNEGTETQIKYLVAKLHYLESGHKLAANAQKGTVSEIKPQWDLPYDIHGNKPDLMINSLSIVGRRTFGMYMEGLINNFYNLIPYDENGKKQIIEYRSFSDNDLVSMETMKEKLHKEYPTFSKEKINKIFNCTETLFDPHTSESLKYEVYLCPIYYQRMTQISDEKISVHNRGRLNKLNQPPSGKQNGGSHRIGEMEFDILATHGVSNLIYEISKDSIEVQENVFICQNCTEVATLITNKITSYYTCLNCENIGLTPIFEMHNITKVAKILISQLKFRGVKLLLKNNPIPVLYPSQLQN